MGIHEADGAFAEAVLVPVENLHRVPDGVSDERAVFVEPLAAAFEVLAQVEVPPGDVRDAQLGGFDRYEVFDAEGRPVTPGRAARIRFFEILVGPREKIEPATIQLRMSPPAGCCRFRQHLLAASGSEVAGDWIAPPPPPTPPPKPTPAKTKRR